MNLGSSGAQSVRLMGTNGETNFEAKGFQKGGYNFKKIAMKLLSNPQIFNYAASGGVKQSIARSLYIMPMGKCPVYGRDGGGQSLDYFSTRYMPTAPGMNNGAVISNGYIAEYRTGALAPVPTNDTLYWQGRFVAQMGVQILKPQVFAKWGVN